MGNIFDLFKKIEKKESASPITHIVAGLGNPGKEYRNTRHNAGYIAVDSIAKKCGVNIDRLKFRSLVSEVIIEDKRVLLMKPQTFMNLSGEAVGAAAAFYKIPAENIIVLCDDISFEPGKIRIRRKGTDGGHNGLKNIIFHLGTNEFPRIKIGVGKKPTPETDLASWVLGSLSESDVLAIGDRCEDIYSAVGLILSGDVDGAMSRYSK